MTGTTRGTAARFQSTLPARGATKIFTFPIVQILFQSTLPARGATIHPMQLDVHPTFQSTLPARGATKRRQSCESPHHISIHAPRTGSDKADTRHVGSANNFNPRSPHGERPLEKIGTKPAASFQSTLPARGATLKFGFPALRRIFQSTLPARGATADVSRALMAMRYFNPRSPHGERRQKLQQPLGCRYFNPRSPHGERRELIEALSVV